MENVVQPMAWKSQHKPKSASTYPLAPLLAGARARGVADAFEWLGLGAILLDERGEVLHLSAGAVEAMQDDLYRDSGLLRARDKLGDVRLRVAISSALRDGESVDLVLPTRGGREELALRVAPIGAELGDDACQLLRVIIVIDRVAAPLETCN
jgi:hypothetical protein